LEYLETTDTPYELAPDLLSHGNAWNETCFELSAPSASATIEAWGSRYTELARPFFKSGMPATGGVLRITSANREPIVPIKERGNPRFVFVHIGDEAKRECMKIADDLRRARIPLTQAMGV